MENKLFGQRIQMARKDRGLIGEKLAELLNIDATYMRQIEGGKKIPSLPVFINICNSLCVSPNYLLCSELRKNELDGLPQLTELWKKASSSQTELVMAMLQAALEKMQNHSQE